MIETNPHLRPAQVGDICLLIEPDPQTNIAPLRSYQASLHTRFGGCPTRHVHLTCQRFCGGKESRLDQSLSAIEQLSSLLMPLPLNAVALHTLPVPILQTTTLKWQIDVSSGCPFTPPRQPGVVPSIADSSNRHLPHLYSSTHMGCLGNQCWRNAFPQSVTKLASPATANRV